jgi:hypothetical protein
VDVDGGGDSVGENGVGLRVGAEEVGAIVFNPGVVVVDNLGMGNIVAQSYLGPPLSLA